MKQIQERIDDFNYSSNSHKAYIAVSEYTSLLRELIEKEREISDLRNRVYSLENKKSYSKDDVFEPWEYEEGEHDEGADYNFKYMS